MKTVKITDKEIDAIINMIDDVENVLECENVEECTAMWDDYMSERINKIREFFKRNEIKN